MNVRSFSSSNERTSFFRNYHYDMYMETGTISIDSTKTSTETNSVLVNKKGKCTKGGVRSVIVTPV